MKKVIMPLPGFDFEPMEAAVPFTQLKKAGCEITIATPDGVSPQCDEHMLHGKAFGIFKIVMAASKSGVQAYSEFQASTEYKNPIKWEEIKAADYDAIVLPGGHAPRMKVYLESDILKKVILEMDAAEKLIAPICHGVVLVSRCIKENGKSILYGKRVTALPEDMEMAGWKLTRKKLGDKYMRTYKKTVQAEVTESLADPSHYSKGKKMIRFDAPGKARNAHFVEDGNLITARFPGDAFTFSQRIIDYLESVHKVVYSKKN